MGSKAGRKPTVSSGHCPARFTCCCYTREGYIEEILENFCKNTYYSDYEPRPLDIVENKVSDYIADCYQAGGNTTYWIVLKRLTMSSKEEQWLTVDSRSKDLIPRQTSGKVVVQYQPITNEQISIWAVKLYKQLTADFNGMEALASESVS